MADKEKPAKAAAGGGKPDRLLAGPRSQAFDLIDVGARMRLRDPLLDVVAQRRLLAAERLEQLVREHFVDGAHPVRALGMAGAGIVLEENGMRQQECGHAGGRLLSECGGTGSQPVGGLKKVAGSRILFSCFSSAPSSCERRT